MKLISYQHQGQPRWGLVASGGVVPLHDTHYPTMLSAMHGGQLDPLAAAAKDRPATVHLDDITLLNDEEAKLSTDMNDGQIPRSWNLWIKRLGEIDLGGRTAQP